MKAGFYEIDITPPLGSDIPGYYRNRPSTGVLHPLLVKACALEQNGTTTLLIVLDSVDVKCEMYDQIATQITAAHGIPAECITVDATHTHLGIPVGDSVSIPNPEFIQIVIERAIDCAARALAALEPAELFYAEAEVRGISFVRNYRIKDGTIQTNPFHLGDKVLAPYSDIDPHFPMLVAKRPDGTPIGGIFSFACHQDCVGGDMYSGDYSCYLSDSLKESFGEGFVSVYIPGASGDINHVNPANPVSGEDHAKMMGKTLADAARASLADAKPMKVDSLWGRITWVDLAVRRATPEDIANAKDMIAHPEGHREFDVIMQENLLKYEKLDMHSMHVPVQVVGIGDVLLYALPGEVYHAFGERLREGTPSGRSLVATNCNGYYGYIPTEDLFGTEIYEIRLCRGSCLPENAGDIVCTLAEGLRAGK